MSFLIVIITAIGLGHFFCIRKGEFFKMPGLYILTGYMSIPLVLFFCDFIVPGYLNLFSRFIFILSLISVALLVFNNKNDLKQELSHPTWLLICMSLIAYLFIPCEYKIHSCDEYSHWLLMPKQIYFVNTLQSVDFTYKFLASYTPGWPTLINYSIYVLNKGFNIGSVHQVAAVGGIATVGLIFDVMKSNNKIRTASSYVLIVILLMAAPRLFEHIFPTKVTVEALFTQVIFCCFIILYIIETKPESWKRNSAILTVLLASGYLIKKPFIIVSIAIVINYVIITYKIHGQSFQSKLLHLFCLLIPCVSVILIWRYRCLDIGVGELFDLSVKGGETFLDLIVSEKSLNIFSSMSIALLKLSIHCAYKVLIIILAFLILKKNKSGKLTFYSFFALFFIYIIGLYWTYLTAFGAYEASYIASFKRYIYNILNPLTGLAFIICSIHFWDKYHRKLSFFFKKQFYVAIAIVFATMLYSSITKINKEPVEPISIAFNNLLNDHQLDRQKIKKVLLISQDSTNFDLLKCKYYSVGTDFRFHGQYSFGEEQNNVWKSVVPESYVVDQIAASDIVLIWKSDKWMNNLLRAKFDIPNMDDYSKIYLIINKESIDLKQLELSES